VAILAMGKPVAFDASADERDTRGFISMTIMRPVAGSTANWMLQAAGVDADRAHDRDGDVAHPLVLAVGQRHRRGDGDRVARVHAHRVDVLDRTDDDHVVGAVAHQLELELLPAEHGLLDEHLAGRARRQPVRRHPAQGRLVAGEAAAGAAEGEARPHHHRIGELGRGVQRLLDAGADGAARAFRPRPTRRSP